jgi:hypothetical protein
VCRLRTRSVRSTLFFRSPWRPPRRLSCRSLSHCTSRASRGDGGLRRGPNPSAAATRGGTYRRSQDQQRGDQASHGCLKLLSESAICSRSFRTISGCCAARSCASAESASRSNSTPQTSSQTRGSSGAAPVGCAPGAICRCKPWRNEAVGLVPRRSNDTTPSSGTGPPRFLCRGPFGCRVLPQLPGPSLRAC